jgi:hypothetical protein
MEWEDKRIFCLADKAIATKYKISLETLIKLKKVALNC